MSSFPQYSFLLLEDNPLDAVLEEERLRAAGLDFRLTLAYDRATFERAFHGNSYDLILADYSLPDFDGLSALEIVRAKYGRLPFIFVSGVLGEDVAVDTILRGATDYVLKSRLERLVPAVQRALTEHEEYLRREKAEAELRLAREEALANSERQGLLLSLLQQQRTFTNPDSLMVAASRKVAEFLGVNQAGFYEVLEGKTLRSLWHWKAGGGTSREDVLIGDFDAVRGEGYRRGEVATVSDIFATPSSNLGSLVQLGLRSFAAVPILRGGAWRAGFWVGHDAVREWTEEESLFLREVGEVTWDSVERARAVAAVEASEQRLRTAAETANLGSWELDLGTGRMVCSDQCKANFGRPLDQDFDYSDLLAAIHPEDRAGMVQAVERAIARGEVYRAEYRNLWPDGSLHWVIAAGRAQYDDGGIPRHMAGFTLDVTGRHKAQAALLQSEKLAAVGRLASSIAHEINNPLEAVTNLLFIAAGSSDNPTTKEYLELADQELRRVSAITTQTLRFHRQAGGPKETTGKELFDSVLVIYRRRLSNSKINLSLSLDSERSILCLDGEIRQVLNNLVSNAIDAMPNGGCLAIRSRDSVRGGVSGIVLTVADSGPGIPLHIREKLFEAFFTTKGINGTGLGLWVSQEIVGRHQGRLSMRSSLADGKHGTVFSLFLPTCGVTGAPGTAEDHEVAEPSGS